MLSAAGEPASEDSCVEGGDGYESLGGDGDLEKIDKGEDGTGGERGAEERSLLSQSGSIAAGRAASWIVAIAAQEFRDEYEDDDSTQWTGQSLLGRDCCAWMKEELKLARMKLDMDPIPHSLLCCRRLFTHPD